MALTKRIEAEVTGHSRNPLVFAWETDNYAAYDARMIMTLSVYIDSAWQDIALIEARPHPVSHYYIFNVQKYLNDFIIQNGFDILKGGDTGYSYAPDDLQFCKKNIIKYQVEVVEHYGETDTIDDTEHVIERRCVHGGLTWEVFNTMPQFFTDTLPSTFQFLTWQPLRRLTDALCPHFLYLYNATGSDISTTKIVIDVNYTDGTSVSVTKNINPTFVDQTIIIIPAGYYLLSVQSIDPTRTVAEYSIRITDGSTAISETRTFVMDWSYQPYTKYFGYQNSLGGFDYFRCTGKADNTMGYEFGLSEIESVIKTKVSSFYYDTNKPLKNDFDVWEEVTRIARSGPKTTYEVNLAREFRLAAVKYELIAESNLLIPIYIDETSLKFPKDGDSIKAFEFKYKYGFKNSVFSPSGII